MLQKSVSQHQLKVQYFSYSKRNPLAALVLLETIGNSEQDYMLSPTPLALVMIAWGHCFFVLGLNSWAAKVMDEVVIGFRTNPCYTQSAYNIVAPAPQEKCGITS